MSPVLDTVTTVRLAPPDKSATPTTLKIQTDSEIDSGLDAQQRTRLGYFILSTAIESQGASSKFSTTNNLGSSCRKAVRLQLVSRGPRACLGLLTRPHPGRALTKNSPVISMS
jgi:hypothetical protein